jgi:hypothetical protein
MDNFINHPKRLTSPADVHYAITPDDNNDLPFKPRAIFCTASGNLAVRDGAGTDVIYPLLVGQILQFRAQRILSTGTTATVVGWE